MMTRFFALLVVFAADARTRRALEETMRDTEVELTQAPGTFGRLVAQFLGIVAIGRVLGLSAFEEATDRRTIAIAGRTMAVLAALVLVDWLWLMTNLHLPTGGFALVVRGLRE